MELLAITNRSTNKEGADVLRGWGCKCIVVTDSTGASAFIGSELLLDDKSKVAFQHDPKCLASESADNMIEIRQRASSAEVICASQ